VTDTSVPRGPAALDGAIATEPPGALAHPEDPERALAGPDFGEPSDEIDDEIANTTGSDRSAPWQHPALA
jgi:hypothetical protein